MSDPSRPGWAAQDTGPEPCNVCGGDGRLENAWGQVAKCPSCHGSGRRRIDTGFHDVTKTKESHYRGSNRAAAAVKEKTGPTSATGAQLAAEIKNAAVAEDIKARLVREIIEHEETHGECTKTFMKKVRKQLRPQA